MRKLLSRTFLEHFVWDEAGFLRMVTQATPSSPGTEPDGRSYTQDNGLATFGTSDWAIADEPSVNGDTFTLDLTGLPIEAGYAFVHAQIEVGSQTRDVRWGGKVHMVLPDLSTKSFQRRHYTTGATNVRIRPVYTVAGAHTGSEGAATLTDSNQSLAVNDPNLVGETIYNPKDQSSGTITATTATTITASLSGGTNNNWSVGDTYVIPGSEVAGAWSSTKSVTPTTGSASVTIHASKTSGTFPCNVELLIEPKGFSDLEPHKLRIKSTAGSGVSDHDRLPATHPWGRGASVVYGYVPAFCFTSAGTHTITVEVTDGTNTASNTVDITVSDPSTLYSSNTHTIGSDGGDDYATFAAALAAVTNAEYVRYQFRRGESHVIGSNITKGKNIYIDAFGSGADPVLQGSLVLRDNSLDGQITVTGVDLEGQFDPTDNTQSTDYNREAIQQSSISSGEFIGELVVSDVGFTGFGKAIAADRIRQIGFANVRYTDNFDYFALISPPAGTFSIVGADLAQNPNTIRGQGKGVPEPDHYGFRFSNCFAPAAFHQLNGYCPYNWSGDGRGSQAMIRWCMSNNSSGQMMSASQIVSEGELGGTPSDNQETIMAGMAVLDKFICFPATDGNLAANAGGVTLRNGICTFGGREYEAARAPSTFIGRENTKPSPNTHWLVEFNNGSGDENEILPVDDVTGLSLTDGKLRGFLHIESGSFAGGDAAGFAVIEVFAGSIVAAETLTAVTTTFDVVSAAPYLCNLDPDGQKAEAYNLTLVHLCTDDELDGNGTNGGVDLYNASASTTIPFSLYNYVLHTPNLTGAKTGTSTADAPLDSTTNWTPNHAGTRFESDILITFSSGTGEFTFETVVTGGTSGATGEVILDFNGSNGIGSGNTTGTILVHVTSGTFQVGETVTGSGGSFVIDSFQTAEANGPFSRTSNGAEVTAYWRPQTGSAAIGDADTDDPVAVDDMFGTLRGGSPSRGALEPA